MKYRHEIKHELNRQDLLQIRQRLSLVMKPDPHASGGRYTVRSLYFDNIYDKALMEKINGLNSREKFRIRLYNVDTSFIRLEKKSRKNGLGTKFYARLTEAETASIIAGDTDWMKSSDDPVIKELGLKMNYQGLKPMTVVEYIREPYIFDPGNVRVSLDYDLRKGISPKEFLKPDGLTIPAGDPSIILEVKWDEFLPDIVRDIVQLPGRRQEAFSKYARCRIYG